MYGYSQQALEVRNSPGAWCQPQYSDEVRQHGGYVALCAAESAPESLPSGFTSATVWRGQRRDEDGIPRQIHATVGIDQARQQRAPRGPRVQPLPGCGGEPQAPARDRAARGGAHGPFRSQCLLREHAAVKKAKFAFVRNHAAEYPPPLGPYAGPPEIMLQDYYRWLFRLEHAHNRRYAELVAAIPRSTRQAAKSASPKRYS